LANRENTLIFLLLGILIIASIFFNSNIEKSAQAVRSNSVGLCNAQWTCLDSGTMAFRDHNCDLSKVTTCGTNERCMNNYCRPLYQP